MFQNFTVMSFRLGGKLFQNPSQFRLILKRQKILYGNSYSSRSSSSKDEDLALVESKKKDIQSELDEDTQLVEHLPKKPEKPVYAEINPRITRIDRREIPEKPKKTKTERRMTSKASDIFEVTSKGEKTKEAFMRATELYSDVERVYKRGHVEFIYEGINRLKEYGLEKDLDAYKALLVAFPKEEIKSKNPWQVEMMHYPKQQQCAIDLMDHMQNLGVCPDDDFGEKLLQIFHEESHALRKYYRIMYWLPKFKYMDPYRVPHNLPDNGLELAILALKRMAFDINTKIKVWKTAEVEESPIEDTFIVSAQSLEQQELIQQHPVETPVFVEGAYTVYLRHIPQSYFVLRADLKPDAPSVLKDEEEEDLFNWTPFYEDENPTDLEPVKTCHEQDDGTVLATCITGTGSKDSLVTWVRYLQQSNKKLEQIPVVFSLKSPKSYLEDLEKGTDKENEEEEVKRLDSPS